MTPAGLRDARKRLGMTQAQLARALKLKSDRTIRRIENGEVEIGGPVQVTVELMLARSSAGIHGESVDCKRHPTITEFRHGR